MAEPRRILWSGGFDSTFLVVQALARGETVEPYYIRQGDGEWWIKQRREREAQRRVIAALPSEMRARLTKLPDDDPIRAEDVWKRLCVFWTEMYEQHHKLPDPWWSPQIPLIAAVAEELHQVEAGFVLGDWTLTNKPARELFAAHGILTPLMDRRKPDLLAEAKAGGFDHLLDLTWSCDGDNQNMVHGPCGVCDPCKHRIRPQLAVRSES